MIVAFTTEVSGEPGAGHTVTSRPHAVWSALLAWIPAFASRLGASGDQLTRTGDALAHSQPRNASPAISSS